MASGGRLIGEFFIALNESQELKELYTKDPALAYREFGLDERQQAILSGANLREIQEEIRKEHTQAAESAIAVMFVMHVAWPVMHVALPDIDDPDGSKS
jgi:hypothetical protein